MRYRSKTRAAAERRLAPTLQAYRQEFPWCQAPGCNRLATDIHELCAGGSRWQARHERACILHLCRVDHETIQGMPLVFQCAVKFLSNSGYDLATILRVKGWAPTGIEAWEVDLIVKGLQRKGIE